MTVIILEPSYDAVVLSYVLNNIRERVYGRAESIIIQGVYINQEK
jgi:hypothetical protein